MKIKRVAKVWIIYKRGAVHDCEFLKFNFEKNAYRTEIS